jgi:Xaa-Pro aminopeptidase
MSKLSCCFVLLLLLLLLLPAATVAQEGFSLFTTDFPPQEFADRRAAVYAAIGDSVAVIQGAPSPAGYTRFRQSNEFYYLCGIEVPHAYLALLGAQRRAILYLPHRNERRERGEGKMLSAEDAEMIKKLSGVDAVFSTEVLAEHLGGYARSSAAPRIVYTPFSPAEGTAMSRDLATRVIADIAADPWDGQPPREGRFIQLLRARYPQLDVRDLTPVLDRLRLIKSQREIAVIKKTTQLSALALMEAMRSTEPGIMEYELDALAKFIYYRHGAQGDAYYSLIASGRNAWYPHYNAGKRKMLDGDFLLMDYAPDVGYYMSDVTRMWPVNGKFNSWQRELYGFYLDCYRAILKSIRPGVTASTIMQEAAQEMERVLARSRFSKPIYETAARKFVEDYKAEAQSPDASLGHWVGMATHDVGHDTGPLRPGMVFTIEPQLRVPEEKIYIRLEDMIVITDKGADILTDFVPMDINGIEKLMREQGILQRYPRENMK